MWVATKTMPADSLTKQMKSPQMDTLMASGHLEMMLQKEEPTTGQQKIDGCEI
jgi:hypothetical protein